MRGILKT